jgi:hypothetical protein
MTVAERDALRRAKRSVSRRTGKPVGDSQERVEIVAPLHGGTLTFQATAPPQADQDRVDMLCLMHVRAFFYMLTYSLEAQVGRYWQGLFHVCGTERRSNWGNERYLAFTGEVQTWPYRLISSVANDYFRIMIRRKAKDVILWSWALEWNKNFRNIGFFGDETLIRAELSKLPLSPMQEISRNPGSTIRIRTDTSLVGPDHLFDIEQALRGVA